MQTRPRSSPARGDRNYQTGCRIISNLGAANPLAAGRAIAALARELGCPGLRVAAVEGDDMMGLLDHVAWTTPIKGTLIGAHAYLGADALVGPIAEGADVVVCGRAADSALFAAPLLPHLDGSPQALAAALTIGHLLECTGQLSGGNFEAPGEPPLTAEDLARLGYPLAHVMPDGTAEITILDDAPGRIDRMTCTVQLLYEVHDPAAYVTPDAIVDFTKIRFDQIGRNRVRMTGPGYRGKPPTLKVSGFVARPGIIADIEIGFAGTGAYERTRRAVETLRLRLSDWSDADIRIDVVGVNSILGEASVPTNALPSEARLHVSAICIDEAQALIVEDEVYALTTVRACGWRGRAQRAACAHRYIDRFHSARAREASCSLECRMRVHTLAAGRAGDKGDALDLTLVARDADAYALLERTLSAEAVRVALNRVAPGSVVRYEVPGLLALKFVAPHALPGGVYASLHAGLHWQKAAIWVLLEMDIEA